MECLVSRNFVYTARPIRNEEDPTTMSDDHDHDTDDFQISNVFRVALFIGAVVLLLGFAGLYLNLS